MTKKQIFFLILIFSFVACKTPYFPTTNHTSLFSHKGEADISLGMSRFGYELQPAYAITKNIGLQSNLLYLWKMTDTAGYATRYGQIAAGYYNKTKKFRYEIYAGYGCGENFFKNNIIDTVKTAKFFVQPAIGIKNDFFLISSSATVGIVKFSGQNNTNITPSLEPNIHLSMGYKNIFFYTTIGMSFLPLASDFVEHHTFFLFSAGLNFRF